jgi:hypothetical protein
MAITLPALMGLSLRKWVALSAFALLIVCACEKHPLGQMPEVQRELTSVKKGAVAEPSTEASQTPAAKATPADFFPETKHP